MARIDFSIFGIHVDHLEGVKVRVNPMNGLGQYQLDGEPEADFSCRHCKDEDYPDDPKLYGSTSRKWADGSVKKYGEGFLKPVYRVVCKRCGGGLIQ